MAKRILLFLALNFLVVLMISFILSVLNIRPYIQAYGLDYKSLLIFCFGAFGFLLYLAKEKTLLRVFREKLHLQKQTNMITRDLSDSYSYIGEMNRKLDIVKDLIFTLPKTTAAALSKKDGDIYASLLGTVSLLGKTDQVALCFINTKKKTIEGLYKKKSRDSFTQHLDPEELLSAGKFFWEEQDYAVVRSPQQAKGIAAFLVFAKTINHIEDSEVFKILASEALLLYCLEEKRQEKKE